VRDDRKLTALLAIILAPCGPPKVFPPLKNLDLFNN
jgi:hypothetical protein